MNVGRAMLQKVVAGWSPVSWRVGTSALALSAMVVAGLFLVPSAWAAPLHQGTEVNEAAETISDQVGVDEPDGAANEAFVNEAQEGIDELEGANNQSELNEGQEGIDELDGQNGDSHESEGQIGTDEADGQNNEGSEVTPPEPPVVP